MKILILGGSGMLGHRLWMTLSQTHEVWVTVRGDASQFPDDRAFPAVSVRPHVDALVFDEVVRVLSTVRPEVLINCIGLIKQRSLAQDPLSALQVNSLLPHRLSHFCEAANIRMIHFSTDCIFSGKRGNYIESDISDAIDLYGRTKYLGEVSYPHTLTLRTSIVGRELKSRRGLIEWFLSQQGQISGYQHAIYTGFTTLEMSRIVNDYVISNSALSGIYHVSSEPISKHDLLCIARDAFNHDVEIIPDTEFVIDRSLDSARFRSITNYSPPSWKDMITELSENSELYEGN